MTDNSNSPVGSLCAGGPKEGRPAAFIAAGTGPVPRAEERGYAEAEERLDDAPRADQNAPCVGKGRTMNAGLRCAPEGRNCARCGFNPAVGRARIRKLTERRKVTVPRPRWSSSYADVHILCPCFKGVDEQNKYVVCDGMQKRTRLLLHVSRRSAFEQAVAHYCSGDYRACAIYRAVTGRAAP